MEQGYGKTGNAQKHQTAPPRNRDSHPTAVASHCCFIPQLSPPEYQTYNAPYCEPTHGASKRLESFIYEYNGSMGDYHPLDPPAFYSSLRKHKESLEEITLCECTYSYSINEPPGDEFMGSFADFTALKELRLRGQTILDWEYIQNGSGASDSNPLSDVFPASLESLIIESFTGCDNISLTTYLETFIRNVKSHCPNLTILELKGDIRERESVTSNGNYMWPRPVPKMRTWYLEMTGNLASLCRQAGIRFRIWDPIAEDIIRRNAVSQKLRERAELNG